MGAHIDKLLKRRKRILRTKPYILLILALCSFIMAATVEILHSVLVQAIAGIFFIVSYFEVKQNRLDLEIIDLLYRIEEKIDGKI